MESFLISHSSVISHRLNVVSEVAGECEEEEEAAGVGSDSGFGWLDSGGGGTEVASKLALDEVVADDRRDWCKFLLLLFAMARIRFTNSSFS